MTSPPRTVMETDLLAMLKLIVLTTKSIVDLVEIDDLKTCINLRAEGQEVATVPLGTILGRADALIAKAEAPQ